MWWRPKKEPQARASGMGRSAKSWSRKATTLRLATRWASCDLPAVERALSWTPRISVPIVGVISETEVAAPRISG